MFTSCTHCTSHGVVAPAYPLEHWLKQKGCFEHVLSAGFITEGFLGVNLMQTVPCSLPLIVNWLRHYWFTVVVPGTSKKQCSCCLPFFVIDFCFVKCSFSVELELSTFARKNNCFLNGGWHRWREEQKCCVMLRSFPQQKKATLCFILC